MGSSSSVSGRAYVGRQGCLRSLVLSHAEPKRVPIALLHPHAEPDSVGVTFIQRIVLVVAVPEPVADVDHELHAHADTHADAHSVRVPDTLTDSDALGY